MGPDRNIRGTVFCFFASGTTIGNYKDTLYNNRGIIRYTSTLLRPSTFSLDQVGERPVTICAPDLSLIAKRAPVCHDRSISKLTHENLNGPLLIVLQVYARTVCWITTAPFARQSPTQRYDTPVFFLFSFENKTITRRDRYKLCSSVCFQLLFLPNFTKKLRHRLLRSKNNFFLTA